MENENHIIPSNAQAELAEIRNDANVLLYKAEEVAKVEGLVDEQRAVEFIANVKRRGKIVDEKRLQYTAPLNAALKAINADFKNVLAPLAEAEAIVKAGISKFRSAEDFRIKEEARKKAEAEARSAISIVTDRPTEEGITRAQEAIAKVEAASAEAPRTVQTERGKMSTRRMWKFEVEDAGSVPREFCAPDPSAIREAVKIGVRDIPGVRIYEEVVPIINS